MMPAAPLLDISDLSVHFQTRDGVLQAVRHVSLGIAPGETFGLAGESGSGKTTLGYAIVRALADNARTAGGTILFEGEDLLAKTPDDLRRIRGRRIGMVYQDPRSALDPTMPVGRQIAEVMEVHERASARTANARARDLLARVNIADPDLVARHYPHQLSGGMQQRVVIAMALAGGPSLLILDEPTTGLDVTTQARILELITDLKHRVGAAILYITHDLGVIAQVSDRVGILYAGELVEVASASRLFAHPAHPYTRGLLEALPDIDGVHGLTPIEGRIPPLTRVPAGCIFAARCALAEPACVATTPAMSEIGEQHRAQCFRWRDVVATPLRAPLASGTRAVPATAITGPVTDTSTGGSDVAAPAGAQRHRAARDATNASAGRADRCLPVLAAERITKYYGSGSRLARRLGLGAPPVRAVDDVSFDVGRDEVLALVGESGCGKTTLGRIAARLLRPTTGLLRFTPYDGPEDENGTALRRAAQIVFQHPDSSLNPMKRVGRVLARPLVLAGLRRPLRGARVRELLAAVRLDAAYADRLPRELSGGEKQRVAIARALAMTPRFIVLDEPVSALDVSTQASIIRLLTDLRRAERASYMLISHDLALVRHVADRIGVMYLGRLVELGTVVEVFGPPSHPYTRALLSAVPRPDPAARGSRITLEGSVPSAQHPPSGCRFHTRCPNKIGRVCEELEPPLARVSATHWIACHIPLDELRALEHPIELATRPPAPEETA
jgi:peptide/nickel transport system ATP-binding protein